ASPCPAGAHARAPPRFVVPAEAANAAPASAPQGGPAENNTFTRNQTATLFPYADLAASAVQAPDRTIADPATVRVSWTVTNVGAGPGRTDSWSDKVIASPSDDPNDPDAVPLGSFANPHGLAPNESYTAQHDITLPRGFTGRFYLFVKANAAGQVFENGSTANNVARKSTF